MRKKTGKESFSFLVSHYYNYLIAQLLKAQSGLRKVMMASRIKEEAVLRDLLRWIETRDFNMTRRQMMPEAQEEAESEESVRWLSYILDNDEAESGKWVQ